MALPPAPPVALARLAKAVGRGETPSFSRAATLCERGEADAVHAILDQASFAHLYTPEGCLAPEDLGLNRLFAPSAAAMRRDPRFVGLCAKLGLVDHWRSTGEWPDFAREVAGVYDLRAEAARLA